MGEDVKRAGPTLSIRRSILAVEVPVRRKWIQPYTKLCRRRSERGVCTSGCAFEKDRGLLELMWTSWEASNRLTHKLSSSKFPCKGSSLKTTGNIWGETKLTDFRKGAGGGEIRATLSVDRRAGRCHRSFVELPPQPSQPGTSGSQICALL